VCVRHSQQYVYVQFHQYNTDPNTLNNHIVKTQASGDGILFHRKFASPFETCTTDIGRCVGEQGGTPSYFLHKNKQKDKPGQLPVISWLHGGCNTFYLSLSSYVREICTKSPVKCSRHKTYLLFSRWRLLYIYIYIYIYILYIYIYTTQNNYRIFLLPTASYDVSIMCFSFGRYLQHNFTKLICTNKKKTNHSLNCGSREEDTRRGKECVLPSSAEVKMHGATPPLPHIPSWRRDRSQSYGTAQRTDFSCSTWTRLQEILEGCQDSWFQIVTEHRSVLPAINQTKTPIFTEV
jgi:hypothetical protein